MGRRLDEVFVCDICNEEFHSEAGYEQHMVNHELVYVGFDRTELKLLTKSILESTAVGMYFNPETVKKLLRFKTGMKG